MTFSIIGTGNIAWFLGNRLVTARHHCVGVYGRTIESAQQLSGALLSDKFGTIDRVRDAEADVCFLAVSDAAIGIITNQLSFKKTVLVHTSGALDLKLIEKSAADIAVFWPIYSIVKNNLPGHRNIPCAWEASSDKAKKYILALGHAVTDELFEAKYEQRKWLHVAAVMSNNFITHLMTICNAICTENALPFTTLQPIIDQTFDRLKNNAPHLVQTGPAIRRDENTIQNHIALLNSHPHWQRIYADITASIQASIEK